VNHYARLRSWKAVRKKFVGRVVYRKGQRRTIVQTYSDIAAGVRLDAPVEGFVSWNLEELRHANGRKIRV
jgi:hypothetical protein